MKLCFLSWLLLASLSLAGAGQAADPPTGPPLSEQEVIGFLSERLGDKPLEHPNRDKVKHELATLIQQRGVNFRLLTPSPFRAELHKYGATSQITFSLKDNYGPPTPGRFFPGAWTMVKVGGLSSSTGTASGSGNRRWRPGPGCSRWPPRGLTCGRLMPRTHPRNIYAANGGTRRSQR